MLIILHMDNADMAAPDKESVSTTQSRNFKMKDFIWKWKVISQSVWESGWNTEMMEPSA